MKARVIVQVNKDTGQRNVVFTTDMMAPLEDFLVCSWKNSEVLTGTVLLLSLDSDTIVEKLMDAELHSVEGSDAELVPCTLTPDMEATVRSLLEGV